MAKSRVKEAIQPPPRPQQDVCCLMGDPVAGNPTQYMLEKAFAIADLDWRFLTFEVSNTDLEAALQGARIFEFRGVMLGSPHGGEVHRFLESVSDAARLSGEVNCVQRANGELRGHNTVGLALRHLVERHLPLKGAEAVVVGDGRAAKSIAAELALAGAARIKLICNDAAAVDPFVDALRKNSSTTVIAIEAISRGTGELEPLPDSCRLLVNANSGDTREASRLKWERFPEGLVVADTTYNPPNTEFVRDARKRGLTVVDGLSLLIEEAAAAFEIWTGRAADRQAMQEAVEEFLVL